MGKIEDAQEILKTLGLPPAQQNDISALTLLALCGLRPKDPWRKTRREGLTITKGIMTFIATEYGRSYAPNTRETFRRQVLHQFVQARIADYNPFKPTLPTNSPRAHYALTRAALAAIQTYGTNKWKKSAQQFINEQGSLLMLYQKKRFRLMVPVRLPDGTILKLSPGKHNEIQAAVIEKFAPRFIPGARLLYLGDTAKKGLQLDTGGLAELNVIVTEHDKLPDVILHDTKRNWLFLIEVVTSHGPMTPKRVRELEVMFRDCKSPLIFVSAFPDFTEFSNHLKEIAWETEVWLVDMPDHMIHFNGDKFLTPQ